MNLANQLQKVGEESFPKRNCEEQKDKRDKRQDKAKRQDLGGFTSKPPRGRHPRPIKKLISREFTP